MIYHELYHLNTLIIKSGETINFSKNKCSELETIDSIFDELEKCYPNIRTWLKNTCYDRDCICAFNSYNDLVGVLIYSLKNNWKYSSDKSAKAWKISTLIVSDKYRREKIGTTLYNSFLKLKTTNDPIYCTNYYNKEIDGFYRNIGFISTYTKKLPMNWYILNNL